MAQMGPPNESTEQANEMPRSLWLADTIADALRGHPGTRFDLHPGWQKAGSDTADHNGTMDHHIGQQVGSTYAAQVRYATTQYPYPPAYNIMTSSPVHSPDTPGLCVVTLVAAGKANHAGVADSDHDDFDGWAAREGNARFLGLGHYGRPGQSWGPQHLEVQMVLDAALLKAMGVGADHQADHKDYATGRKDDRHSIDTDEYRRDLAAYMEDDMPLSDADIKKIAAAIKADGDKTRRAIGLVPRDVWRFMLENWVLGKGHMSQAGKVLTAIRAKVDKEDEPITLVEK